MQPVMRLTQLPDFVRTIFRGSESYFNYSHHLVFMWIVTLQTAYSSNSRLITLSRYSPSHITYSLLKKFISSAYWFTSHIWNFIILKIISKLPPPEDGILYIIADSTTKAKRGKNNPANKYKKKWKTDPFLFGLEIFFIILHWNSFRIPVWFKIIRKKDDPTYKNDLKLFSEA